MTTLHKLVYFLMSKQVNPNYSWIVKPVLQRGGVSDDVGISPKHNFEGDEVEQSRHAR